MTATAPTITVAMDIDQGEYFLEATSYSVTNPAGPRLFRANPPAIQFRHTEYAEAVKDAAKLQGYLDAAFSGKARKTRGEEAEVVAAPVVDLSQAWWK